MDEARRQEQCGQESGEVVGLLALVRDLGVRLAAADSTGALLAGALEALHQRVPYDVGAVVMLEQNLDLYMAARKNAESLAGPDLVDRIRLTLERLIPVSLSGTDIVVKAETHQLPSSGHEPTLDHDAAAVLAQERRTSGLAIICRGSTPFSVAEQRILDMFAAQLSLLVDMMDARQRIANLADTDDLTGIWNRRYFRRQLPFEIERARTFRVPLSVLLLDIDEFKQINDSFGHVVGDVVLSELCGTIHQSLRPTDTFARFGGDEFAILLPHTDLVGASSVADRLLKAVGELTIPADDEVSIRCSVSIGIAEYEPGDVHANDLIRRADERLYVSKRQGKNRYTA